MNWFDSDANKELYIEDATFLSPTADSLNNVTSKDVNTHTFDNWDFDLSEDIIQINDSASLHTSINNSIPTQSSSDIIDSKTFICEKKKLPSWLEEYWLTLLDNYLHILKETKSSSYHLLVLIYSRALNVVPATDIASFLSRCNISVPLKLKLWLLSYLHDDEFENSNTSFDALLNEFKVDYLDNELIDLILCCDKFPSLKKININFKFVEDLLINFFKNRSYGDIVSYRSLNKMDDFFLGSLLHLICFLISDHKISMAANLLRLSNLNSTSLKSDRLFLKEHLLLKLESIAGVPSFELDMLQLALNDL